MTPRHGARAATVLMTIAAGLALPTTGHAQQADPGPLVCRDIRSNTSQRYVYDLGDGSFRVRVIEAQVNAWEDLTPGVDAWAPTPADAIWNHVEETVLPEFSLVPGSVRVSQGTVSEPVGDFEVIYTPVHDPAPYDEVTVTGDRIEWLTDNRPVAGSKPSDYGFPPIGLIEDAAGVLEYDLRLSPEVSGTVTPVTDARVLTQKLTYYPPNTVVANGFEDSPAASCEFAVPGPRLDLTVEAFADPALTDPVTTPVRPGTTVHLRVAAEHEPAEPDPRLTVPDGIATVDRLEATGTSVWRATTDPLRHTTDYPFTATAPDRRSTVVGDHDAIPTTVVNRLTDDTLTAEAAVTVRVSEDAAPMLPVTGRPTGALLIGGGFALVLGLVLARSVRSRGHGTSPRPTGRRG